MRGILATTAALAFALPAVAQDAAYRLIVADAEAPRIQVIDTEGEGRTLSTDVVSPALLDVLTTNACRPFQVDAVTARLIWTYRGRGTQCGVSTDGAETRPIFQVATGAPIPLRGTIWLGEQASRSVHRSPPIEGRSETRLVLALDSTEDPEEEA